MEAVNEGAQDPPAAPPVRPRSFRPSIVRRRPLASHRPRSPGASWVVPVLCAFALTTGLFLVAASASAGAADGFGVAEREKRLAYFETPEAKVRERRAAEERARREREPWGLEGARSSGSPATPRAEDDRLFREIVAAAERAAEEEAAASGGRSVYVRGYFRNGHWVRGYVRHVGGEGTGRERTVGVVLLILAVGGFLAWAVLQGRVSASSANAALDLTTRAFDAGA